jgi:hypothetical protein
MEVEAAPPRYGHEVQRSGVAVAVKGTIREACPDCGEIQAELRKDEHEQPYVWITGCSCPHPPGPKSPPRRYYLSSNIFLPVEEDGA